MKLLSQVQSEAKGVTIVPPRLAKVLVMLMVLETELVNLVVMGGRFIFLQDAKYYLRRVVLHEWSRQYLRPYGRL
jgi:hypothetical protein